MCNNYYENSDYYNLYIKHKKNYIQLKDKLKQMGGVIPFVDDNGRTELDIFIDEYHSKSLKDIQDFFTNQKILPLINYKNIYTHNTPILNLLLNFISLKNDSDIETDKEKILLLLNKLIEYGADSRIENIDGISALSIIKQHNKLFDASVYKKLIDTAQHKTMIEETTYG